MTMKRLKVGNSVIETECGRSFAAFKKNIFLFCRRVDKPCVFFCLFVFFLFSICFEKA